MSTVVLVGNPNVGKSVIFNYLTGTYATVSNYPGTTVDILCGKTRIGNQIYEVIDTPGLYSLIPLTEEEKVTRMLLSQKKSDVVIHVVDTKNIRRMLTITLQLLEAGLPVILDLNIIDEAKRAGVIINSVLLSEVLAIPVIETSAVKNIGLEDLKKAIRNYTNKKTIPIQYSKDIEDAIHSISCKLTKGYGLDTRMIALLLLANDHMVHEQVVKEEAYPLIIKEISFLQNKYSSHLNYVIAQQRQAAIDNILKLVMVSCKQRQGDIFEKLGRYAREPITGIPILCIVLYFGLYQIVGKFGAGFLVDYIDKEIFAHLITPWVIYYTQHYVDVGWMQSLIVGEYGIFTLGVRYAMVIVLPIVGTFFLVFALLEDAGYLPRLAMLVDSLFKYFGLNGRAIIPITLGTGCGTMAVMVTRTLETKRERILATFLLALTIPCSAQLGVILSLLSHNSIALGIWSCYITCMFIVVGWGSAKLLPGARSNFYIEIPPLRLPMAKNIIKKAWFRMYWYFIEILPVFIFTSLVMWLLDYYNLLKVFIAMIDPLMARLGLPYEITPAFLLGFFRRDYGAAGLYDLSSRGLLSDNQLLVAAITLTLFVPCIAQLAVMIKERGFLLSIMMLLLIAGLAFASGWFVHQLLTFYSIAL